MKEPFTHSFGLNVANGLIIMGLMDALIAKGVLSTGEVRGVLQNAIATLTPKVNIASASEAITIIRDRMLPEFPE